MTWIEIEHAKAYKAYLDTMKEIYVRDTLETDVITLWGNKLVDKFNKVFEDAAIKTVSNGELKLIAEYYKVKVILVKRGVNAKDKYLRGEKNVKVKKIFCRKIKWL